MQEGDPLIVFNGSDWEYDAVIRHAQAGALALEITGKRPVPLDEIEITLCQAIPKAEKMDGIIRHATELGARADHPLPGRAFDPPLAGGKRSAEAGALAEDRRRGRAPVRQDRYPRDRGDCIVRRDASARARNGALRLIPWEEEAGRGIREVLRDPRYDGTKSFHLVIGPEGGFSPGRNRPGAPGGFPARQPGQAGAPRGDGGAGGARHPPVRTGRHRRRGYGETSMTDRLYGGFWRRLVAYAIDKIILYFISLFLFLIALLALGLSGGVSLHRIAATGDLPRGMGLFFVIYATAMFITDMIYFIWFHGSVGQTPGKMLLGLRVIQASGETDDLRRRLPPLGRHPRLGPLPVARLSLDRLRREETGMARQDRRHPRHPYGERTRAPPRRPHPAPLPETALMGQPPADPQQGSAAASSAPSR